MPHHRVIRLKSRESCESVANVLRVAGRRFGIVKEDAHGCVKGMVVCEMAPPCNSEQLLLLLVINRWFDDLA